MEKIFLLTFLFIGLANFWGLISPQHFDDMATRTKPLARRALPRMANPALLE